MMKLKGEAFFVWVVIFCMSYGLVSAVSNKTVGWDQEHSFFYNKARFPEGVSDRAGSSVISSKHHAPVLFAWDLHGVVLRTQYEWAYFVLSKIGAVVKHEGFFSLMGLIKECSATARVLRKTQKKQGIQETGMMEILYHVFGEKEFPKNPKITLTMLKNLQGTYVSFQCLDKGVIAVLDRLTERGCEHVICSNMSRGEAEAIKIILEREEAGSRSEKLKKMYASAGLLFSKKNNFFVSTAGYLVKKPAGGAYAQLLEKNPGPHAVRIFIDDKSENVRAAVTHGFDIGILFVSRKQLLRSLGYLGFLK
jgi:hypothetical protein